MTRTIERDISKDGPHMIKVHHLQYSRSTRILWLLEELGLPYEMAFYERDPKTMRRPDALKAIHPLGKAPVIEEDGIVIAESGAIVEYIIQRHGGGRLAPAVADPLWPRYIEWMHFAEGSAMLGPIVTMTSRGEGIGAPYGKESTELALGFIDAGLDGQQFLVGDELTGADIQIFYVLDFARSMNLLGERRNIPAYLERLEARPALRRAIEKGGPVSLPRPGSRT